METMLSVQTKLVVPSTGGRKSRLANADTTLGKLVRYVCGHEKVAIYLDPSPLSFVE